MKISLEFLQSKNACAQGLHWVTQNNFLDLEDHELIRQLIKYDKLSWAVWLIVRVMTRSQSVACIVYAVEQILELSEKKFPHDGNLNNVIISARKWLKSLPYKNVVMVEAVNVVNAAAMATKAIKALAVDDEYANILYIISAIQTVVFCVTQTSDPTCIITAAEVAEHATVAIDAAADADIKVYSNRAYKDMELKIIKYGLTLLKKEREDENIT